MLKVAWRNLWRNRTRTLVTVTAVAITYGMYLMMMGIQEYTYGQMNDAASKAAGGMVLVQAKGFQDQQLNDMVVGNADHAMAAVKALPEVSHVAPRVLINGLLSTSSAAMPTRLQGVDPAVEMHFQDLSRYVTKGTFLQGDEEDPIVLGSRIVDKLEIEIGDRVILTASGSDGEMQRALFHLTGVLHTNSRLTDETLAFTTIAAARGATGHKDVLSQIGLLGPVDADAMKAAVGAALSRDDVEVMTWADAMPDLVGFIEMDRAYGNVFAIVMFMVVWFAIMNTFLMVVMERVRELGLLNALGLTPARIAQLVFLETFFLAVVALSVGLGLGLLGHFVIDANGIDMAAMYGTDSVDVAGVALTDTLVRSTITISRWINASLSVLVMVLLSAAYPAFKATRLQPSEAMRFYE